MLNGWQVYLYQKIFSENNAEKSIYYEGAVIMDEQTAKRTRRTPQQMAADVDSKIERTDRPRC